MSEAVEEITKEEPKKEPKQEKVYLNTKALKGKFLFCCDILTGEVSIVKPKKEKHRPKNANGTLGKKVVKQYVITTPNLFYLSGYSLKEARDSFQKQFDEMAKSLEKKGEDNKENKLKIDE